MDTQAMTLGGKATPEQIQKRRDSIAPMEVNKVNLISDALKVELKQLINEVLDEKTIKKSVHLTLSGKEFLVIMDISDKKPHDNQARNQITTC